MRPMLLKKGEEAIDKQFTDVENSIEQLLNTMGWNTDETEIIIGGDFNTNLESEEFTNVNSMPKKPSRNNKLENLKGEALTRLIDKFALSDAFRHRKNSKLYRDKPGYTYNPRRKTANPSRIDFFFVSNSIINACEKVIVNSGPKSDINSDHEYVEMGIYTAKQRRSRTDRRKNYKFPDYLMNNKDFMFLM